MTYEIFNEIIYFTGSLRWRSSLPKNGEL